MYESLISERRNDVVLLTLNRPKAMNALDRTLRNEIVDACGQLRHDPTVRVVIMTGAGERAFSAGQDLTEAKAMTTLAEAEENVREYDVLYAAVRSLDIPVIAAINGYALGAGCQVALCADIRVSADTARYGMPEINAGMPCVIGTQMFWEFIGPALAIDLVLTGEHLDAQRALVMGLVTRVVAANNLMAETEQLARRLAQKSTVALRETKRWIRDLSEPGLHAALRRSATVQEATMGGAKG
jgi:enoyl-CoA hydratase/carnithine racemase